MYICTSNKYQYPFFLSYRYAIRARYGGVPAWILSASRCWPISSSLYILKSLVAAMIVCCCMLVTTKERYISRDIYRFHIHTLELTYKSQSELYGLSLIGTNMDCEMSTKQGAKTSVQKVVCLFSYCMYNIRKDRGLWRSRQSLL